MEEMERRSLLFPSLPASLPVLQPLLFPSWSPSDMIQITPHPTLLLLFQVHDEEWKSSLPSLLCLPSADVLRGKEDFATLFYYNFFILLFTRLDARRGQSGAGTGPGRSWTLDEICSAINSVTHPFSSSIAFN